MLYILIFNAAIYVLTFCLVQLYLKKINLSSYILFCFMIANISSVYYYLNSDLDFSLITVQPFVYLYILFFICVFPLIGFDSSKIEIICSEHNDKFLELITLFFIFVSFVPFIENLLLATNVSPTDLGNIYNRDVGESSLLYHRLSWVGRNCNKISLWGAYIMPFLFFFNLTKRDVNKFIYYGLLMGMGNLVLNAYVYAARVDIIRLFMCLVVCFYIFKNQIPALYRKRIIYSAFFLSFILLSGLFLITYIRFSNFDSDIDIYTWITLYLGEGPLRFNSYMWYIKTNMNGDNCFPFFKSILGFHSFLNSLDRRVFWEPKIGILNNVFYTFIGDFYADLGAYYTFLLFSTLSIIFYKAIRFVKNIYCDKLFLIYIFSLIYMFGFMHYIFKVYDIQIRFFVSILFYFILFFNRKFRLHN